VALFNATANANATTTPTPLQPPPPHAMPYSQQHHINDESAVTAAAAAAFASTHSNLFENTLLFHPQHNQMPFNIAAVAAAAYSNFKQCSPLAMLQNQHQQQQHQHHHHPFSTSVNPSQSTSPSPLSTSSLYQRNYLEALRFYKAAYESK